MQNSEEGSNTSEKEYAVKTTFHGVRYLFTIMCFLGVGFMFAARCNISVAIVAMVNHTAVNNNTHSDECPDLKGYPENISDPFPIIIQDGEFIWPPRMQGLVLGSFYYIFSVMQIPGGRFSEIFSGKWVFFSGLTISLFLTLLIPYAAYNSFHLLILIRMLIGAAQGVCFPAIFNLMGLWFPNTEKNILQNIVMSGINVGIFTSMLVTGYLCNTKFLGGWPSSFYMIGLVGLVFCVFWIFLVSDTPKGHPFISAEELEYITKNQSISPDVELPVFPWKRVLTSSPLWAVVIAQVGADWSYYTLLNHLPQYFYDILHFDLEANGLLSSFPYLLEASTAVLSGYISDVVLRKELVSTLFARRFFNTIAGVGSAIGLAGVMVAGCNVMPHIVFFAFVMAISGFCYSGYLLNVLDLSPEYAGTVMGIMNTASTLGGFLTSAVAGHFTDKENTMQQWGYVYLISILMLLCSTTFFLMFSTAEKQMWHLPKEMHAFNFASAVRQAAATTAPTEQPISSCTT